MPGLTLSWLQQGTAEMEQKSGLLKWPGLAWACLLLLLPFETDPGSEGFVLGLGRKIDETLASCLVEMCLLTDLLLTC